MAIKSESEKKYKKIYCKKCGYVSRFTILEKVSRRLIFDEFDEPDGCTEEVSIYNSDVKRCLICNRKVTIVEVPESKEINAE